MYKLTPRMLKEFKFNLRKYHDLSNEGRCMGIQQQELIVNSIKADKLARDNVLWPGKGHDDNSDIVITREEIEHHFKIISGKETKEHIKISGYRLGRYDGNFNLITQEINSGNADIICVTYRKKDDNTGFKHIYQLCYLDINKLKGLTVDGWQKKGNSYIQLNSHNVEFSLHSSMSWQLWWNIPKDLFEKTSEIVITKDSQL